MSEPPFVPTHRARRPKGLLSRHAVARRIVSPTARVLALGAGLSLLVPAAASAQGAKTSADQGDQAGATALFYEARALMKKGEYAKACPKLEESLRLDYGIGTEFNLADCNEQLGKLAAAWSGFMNVAAEAKAANQAQREKVARDRAKALEPRLPKLVVEVPSPSPGLQVERDGVTVGAAAWGTEVPVDPGKHEVVAKAPGKKPWKTTVTATERNTTRVTVPRELPAAEVAVAPLPPPLQITVPPATTTTPPPPAAPSTFPADFPEPVVEKGRTQRTVGWVLSAAGLASLGVGAGFGLHSLSKRDESDQHCTGDLCNATGVRLRDDAIQSGNVSTITTIAGGAALLGGIVLIATAPSGQERRFDASAKKKLQAVPHVGLGGGGLTVQGVLP